MTARESPRFAFGRNWRRFLAEINEDRIRASTDALAAMLGRSSLAGERFLDVGCGSGLSSLAAVRLGAQVHAFDFDRESVACAETLRARFAPEAAWHIERGDALDQGYLEGLGTFDVVYSWGVLHHTGRMWTAIAQTATRVGPGGQFFLALYNDQGWRSKLWTLEKRVYVAVPPIRPLLIGGGLAGFVVLAGLADLSRGRLPWRRYREPGRRGMSVVPDLVDWLGGYPFEVASPDAVQSFLTARGFEPQLTRDCGNRSGCNEFVFRAMATPAP